MFGFGHRKEDERKKHSNKPQRTPRRNNRKRSGGHQKQVQAAIEQEELPTVAAGEVSEDKMNRNEVVKDEEVTLDETDLGIEVSFELSPTTSNTTDADDLSSSRTDDSSSARLRNACVNLSDQMRKRNKVYRTQFSVDFPLLPKRKQHDAPTKRRHRMPLFRKEIEDGNEDYDDVLLLLQSQPAAEEEQAVKDELSRTIAEIESLEEDRADLEKKYLNLPTSSEKPDMDPAVWNIHYLLRSEKTMSMQDRIELQKRRGNCFTFHLHSEGTREAFSSICGSRVSEVKSTKNKQGSSLTLSPANCIENGAAQTVGHVALMRGTDGAGAIFAGRDDRKALCYGYIPRRLFRRMQRLNLKIARDLVYLSTGPCGCYFAEFRSGECLWGNSLRHDKDFQTLVREWDVYRVVFGPIQMYKDDDGCSWTTNSWIVLGFDGRVAWKNLPSRLHRILESRLADWPAPAEVSLGSDGAYFVRFLDGTIDYCLPAAIANVCESILKRGGSITCIELHPDVSQDYIIRHTQTLT